jgi:hypothetical protein
MNQDAGRRFPNQNIERRFTECVGETIADIIGNIEAQLFDPDFNYAAAFAAEGLTPTDAGEDVYAGMFGQVAYGSLPESNDYSDPIQTSELIEANFANYTTEQKQTARLFRQNAIKVLTSWGDIVEHLSLNQGGVAMGMKWYDMFNSASGILQAPPLGSPFTYHCVAVYEMKDNMLRVKPWLGPHFADKGYCWLPFNIFAFTFQEAFAFDPNGSRWWTLVRAALWNASKGNPQGIWNLLPLIKESASMK